MPVDLPDDLAQRFARSTASGRGWLRTVLEGVFRQNGQRLPPEMDRWLTDLESRARLQRMADEPEVSSGGGSGFPHAQNWVSASEYARRLGVSRQAVTKRCRSGSLPAEFVDGKWRLYPKDDIQ